MVRPEEGKGGEGVTSLGPAQQRIQVRPVVVGKVPACMEWSWDDVVREPERAVVVLTSDA